MRPWIRDPPNGYFAERLARTFSRLGRIAPGSVAGFARPFLMAGAIGSPAPARLVSSRPRSVAAWRVALGIAVFFAATLPAASAFARGFASTRRRRQRRRLAHRHALLGQPCGRGRGLLGGASLRGVELLGALLEALQHLGQHHHLLFGALVRDTARAELAAAAAARRQLLPLQQIAVLVTQRPGADDLAAQLRGGQRLDAIGEAGLEQVTLAGD